MRLRPHQDEGEETGTAAEFLRHGYSVERAGDPRGRPRKPALAGDLLRVALKQLPYSLDDFFLAIASGSHRTEEQKQQLAVLSIFIAVKKPRMTELAALLGLKWTKGLYRYQKKGQRMIAELTEEIRRQIDEANESQLKLILAALGLNPVAEAEQALEASESVA